MCDLLNWVRCLSLLASHSPFLLCGFGTSKQPVLNLSGANTILSVTPTRAIQQHVCGRGVWGLTIDQLFDLFGGFRIWENPSLGQIGAPKPPPCPQSTSFKEYFVCDGQQNTGPCTPKQYAHCSIKVYRSRCAVLGPDIEHSKTMCSTRHALPHSLGMMNWVRGGQLGEKKAGKHSHPHP